MMPNWVKDLGAENGSMGLPSAISHCHKRKRLAQPSYYMTAGTRRVRSDFVCTWKNLQGNYL